MQDIALTDAQLVGLVILLTWSYIWKGFALWRAAIRGDKGWFITFLAINTAGLLEILYLYVIARKPK